MDTTEFDSESIIIEVEKCPALYDPSNENYKNRTVKLEAWQKVAEAVAGDEYKTLDLRQQSRIGKEIQRRWKALKDAYARSLKLQLTTSGNKKRPYIYHNQLAFLQPILQNRSTSENVENIDENQIDNFDEIIPTSVASSLNLTASTSATSLQHPTTSTNATALQKKRKKEIFESQLIGILRKNSLSLLPSNEDPNELFFRSLLPKMKKLSDQDVCSFQIDVLQLLQKYLSNARN